MTGSELKALREKVGLSQKDLAGKLRLNQTRISLYERGALVIAPEVEEKIEKVLVEFQVRRKTEPPVEKGRPKKLSRAEKDAKAKEEWDRKTAEYVEKHGRESTDRAVISKESMHQEFPSETAKTETIPLWDETPRMPIEVRVCHDVTLSRETLLALSDLILKGIRALREEPVAIRPEVLRAEKEADRYRARTQELLGRGY